jgi:hypothetical protein
MTFKALLGRFGAGLNRSGYIGSVVGRQGGQGQGSGQSSTSEDFVQRHRGDSVLVDYQT